ncbi:kynureninase [Nocardiopsis ansamitocini]|uniref:Kynureninase n=1 Tax=Nocardiopsis ansamitocini TaxID=1670832 RepID=A0A9W6P6C9_9ACTN|nr:aminotransferase class V-fold PLP-dependent enzyme [Nocardiopsis ansamitocini]GLU47857.1 kynureninase [Nocardiopsis ansamitocini]
MPDSDLTARAAELDRADPLASYRQLFVGVDDPDVVAYLDGNSLGRPLKASAAEVSDFVSHTWGSRLIRAWDEQWFDLPLAIGDRLAAAALGAAGGQTVVGDSTTVLLYKLVRAGLALRPGRTEIVVDRDNFPTDRYVLEGVAAELGLTLRWIESDPCGGVTPEEVRAVVGPRTALVVLSHVAYRSGYLLDAPAVTEAVHESGALLLLDLCHSVGSVPVDLDAWGVDLAVGCTYKYLNGGPGSPAFAYVRAEYLPDFAQPIWGWMGSARAFEMGQGYVPADGIRRVISGTPVVSAMIAMQGTIALIEEVGMTAIRAKSVALTEFALRLVDAWLTPYGVEVSSPTDAERRGGHVTIDHPAFKGMAERLWERGVIPDFRRPQGLRLGLSPLSTSFTEVLTGVAAIRDELARA